MGGFPLPGFGSSLTVDGQAARIKGKTEARSRDEISKTVAVWCSVQLGPWLLGLKRMGTRSFLTVVCEFRGIMNETWL